jgi:hypothetical protein
MLIFPNYQSASNCCLRATGRPLNEIPNIKHQLPISFPIMLTSSRTWRLPIFNPLPCSVRRQPNALPFLTPTFSPSYLPSVIAVYHDLAPRLSPISKPIKARVKKKRTMCPSLVNGIRINKISPVKICIIINSSYGPN